MSNLRRIHRPKTLVFNQWLDRLDCFLTLGFRGSVDSRYQALKPLSETTGEGQPGAGLIWSLMNVFPGCRNCWIGRSRKK